MLFPRRPFPKQIILETSTADKSIRSRPKDVRVVQIKTQLPDRTNEFDCDSKWLVTAVFGGWVRAEGFVRATCICKHSPFRWPGLERRRKNQNSWQQSHPMGLRISKVLHSRLVLGVCVWGVSVSVFTWLLHKFAIF